jgi:hypothetical protein
MTREISRRARSVLARPATGDVDAHELATLALDAVAQLEEQHPYRADPARARQGTDAVLAEMASLERQLGECRAQLAECRAQLEEARREIDARTKA